MRKLIILLFILFPINSYSELTEYADIIVLNKVTAAAKTYRMKVGETYAIYRLDIAVQKCDKTEPEDPPESAVYLTIQEPEKSEKILFQGWMFASNPSINSLEHSVYDVWLKSCN